MYRRLALAGAAAFVICGLSAQLAQARATWNQFPSTDLVGLRASITFSVPNTAEASTTCPVLSELDANAYAQTTTYTLSAQPSASGWTVSSDQTPEQLVALLDWSSAGQVGNVDRLAYAESSVPITAPASAGYPPGVELDWGLNFSTSPAPCRGSVPYRIAEVGSPVGNAYPILWRLSSGEATGGLGCGFLNVTSEPSPTGSSLTVTETVVLTDAVSSQSTTFEELACSSGRVVPSTTDPAQTGADLDPKATVATVVAGWRHELVGATKKPPKSTTSSSQAALLARLRRADRLYAFQVASIQMLQYNAIAPLVVVKTANRTAFTRSMAQILALVNPTKGTGAKAKRTYPAFFLEAVDGTGAPFVAAFSFTSGGGGQWADDGDFPFPHG